MQRWHGSERVTPQHIVKTAPALTPEALAVLDHHAGGHATPAPLRCNRARPPTTAARSGSPSSTRRPGRRRRTSAPLRSGRGWDGGQDVGDRSVRNEEPHPVRPDEDSLEAPDAPGAREAVAEPGRRDLPEPDEGVDADRVTDLHALTQSAPGRRRASRRRRGTPTSATRRRRRLGPCCAAARRTARRVPLRRRRARPRGEATASGAGQAQPRPSRRGPRRRRGWPLTPSNAASIWRATPVPALRPGLGRASAAPEPVGPPPRLVRRGPAAFEPRPRLGQPTETRPRPAMLDKMQAP